MSSTRRMPSETAIRRHWSKRLWKPKGFDSESEFLEKGVCFACGLIEFMERAHITARAVGGKDDVSNLHMLCKRCHKDSELLDGDKYWQWFMERGPLDQWYSKAVRSGLNVWHELQLAELCERGGR